MWSPRAGDELSECCSCRQSCSQREKISSISDCPPLSVTVCVNHGCEVWNSLWCLQTMNCFAPLTWLDAYTLCGCLQSEQVVVSTGRCGRSRHRRERERERGELGRNFAWRCTNNFSGVTLLHTAPHSSTAAGWLRLSWLSNIASPAREPVLEQF